MLTESEKQPYICRLRRNAVSQFFAERPLKSGLFTIATDIDAHPYDPQKHIVYTNDRKTLLAGTLVAEFQLYNGASIKYPIGWLRTSNPIFADILMIRTLQTRKYEEEVPIHVGIVVDVYKVKKSRSYAVFLI